jgi:hypothetical protein
VTKLTIDHEVYHVPFVVKYTAEDNKKTPVRSKSGTRIVVLTAIDQCEGDNLLADSFQEKEGQEIPP